MLSDQGCSCFSYVWEGPRLLDSLAVPKLGLCGNSPGSWKCKCRFLGPHPDSLSVNEGTVVRRHTEGHIAPTMCYKCGKGDLTEPRRHLKLIPLRVPSPLTFELMTPASFHTPFSL